MGISEGAVCVLDASVVLRLITCDPFTQDPMSASWAEQLQQASLVLCPELMLTEVANGLWKLQRAGKLGGIDPQLLLVDARDLVDRIEADRHLQVEALAIACHYRWNCDVKSLPKSEYRQSSATTSWSSVCSLPTFDVSTQHRIQ